MEYDPAEVPELIEPIVRGAADVVFGSRLSRRPAAARVPLLAPRRQPLPLAADERPLQHDALRHGDRLQGVPHRRPALARPARGRASRSSPRSPAKVCKRKLRIYELPISYYGRTLRRGQEDHLARRLQARSFVLVPRAASRLMLEGKTVAVVVPAYDEEALIGDDARRHPRLRRPRSSSSTTPRRDATAERARAFGDPRVEVDRRTSATAGVGAAIVTGYKRALAERIDVDVRDGRRQPDGSGRARDARAARSRAARSTTRRRTASSPAEAWEVIPHTATSATRCSRC